jgi:molybdenum cofactor biosynthesis protein MoaF
MTHEQRAPEIRGKTIRFIWTEGPTKGTTHEHVFHRDGTVEWHAAGGPQKGQAAEAKPEYAAMKVADGIYAVSYLATSGYTLTAVLNFHGNKIVGFASGAKEWYPVQGTFEVVE